MITRQYASTYVIYTIIPQHVYTRITTRNHASAYSITHPAYPNMRQHMTSYISIRHLTTTTKYTKHAWWYVLICAGVWWYAMVYADVRWRTMVHVVVWSRILSCVRVRCCMLVCFYTCVCVIAVCDECRCILVYAGVLWWCCMVWTAGIALYFHVCVYMMLYTTIPVCMSVYAGVCVYMMMYAYVWVCTRMYGGVLLCRTMRTDAL